MSIIRRIRHVVTNRVTRLLPGQRKDGDEGSDRFVRGLLVEAGTLHLLVRPDDAVVGRQLRDLGRYGVQEFATISALTSPASTVVFVGTHVGALALPTARYVRKAYLIEANPNTFQYLELNCRLNGITNATLFNCAAGESEGSVRFVMNTINSGGSKREPKIKEHMYYYDDPETISIPMRRIDQIVDPHDIIDLVFMDIEGSEYFALQGMQGTLSRTRALMMEFIGHHLRNVSGVTVAELVALLRPHFDRLHVPSTGETCDAEAFTRVLTELYDSGRDEDALVFTKSDVAFLDGRQGARG